MQQEGSCKIPGASHIDILTFSCSSYIRDLDPWSIIAIAQTLSRDEAHAVKYGLYNHVSFRAFFDVNISVRVSFHGG